MNRNRRNSRRAARRLRELEDWTLYLKELRELGLDWRPQGWDR